MDVTRFVDTSGSVPSLRVGALVSTLVGAVVYGWLYGFIGFVDTWLGGIAGAISSLGSYLSGALIPTLFAGLSGPVEAAWQSNAEFVASLGTLGMLVAALELALVLFIVLAVVERLLESVRVVTP